MTYANATERQALISGLRELAGFERHLVRANLARHGGDHPVDLLLGVRARGMRAAWWWRVRAGCQW
jgi:hypothetical protein